MSYCRFSDDNFRSDFYAYEDARGYTLHVAASRLLGNLPPSPYKLENLETLSQEEWEKTAREHRLALGKTPSEDIPLPGAGRSHHFATLRELRDKVRDLTDLGFHAPHWLLPQLEEEMRDEEMRDEERENA